MVLNPVPEKYLTLSDGRTLAYTETGDPNSQILALLLHGMFGVGSITVAPPIFQELGVHYITPTLAGWGLSDPRPSSKPIRETLPADITELIQHAHPDTSNVRIYIAGGSYGSAYAQILYGAPFEVFPLGRQIKACVLVVPLSPFYYHKGYAKNMTWQNYIGVGPLAVNIPFHLLQRLILFALKSKLGSVDDAEKFLRDTLWSNLVEEEKEAFGKWREKYGYAEGEFQRHMAENCIKSISKSTAGYLEVADVLHADWGFNPSELDDEHTTDRRVLVVPGTEDKLGSVLPEWLAANYKNARLRWIPGGHISPLYSMDEIWKEVLYEGEGLSS